MAITEVPQYRESTCIATLRGDIEVLRTTDPSCESGYHGVYPHKRGWIPKAFSIQIAPVQRRPVEAARKLVQWWRYHFGGDWKAFYDARNLQAWTIVPHEDGWRVRVWILGIPHWIGNRSYQGKTYSSKKEARAGLEMWLEANFGMFLPISFLWLRRRQGWG